MKATYNQFHFQMSAMLFIGEGIDKDALILELFHKFHESNFLYVDDFVESYFEKNIPGVDSVYIRETFNQDKFLGHAKNLQTS